MMNSNASLDKKKLMKPLAKSTVKSWLLILMTLMLVTRSATAAGFQRLNKGAVAPYKGVLIQEDYYRMMTSDIEKGEELKAQYSQFVDREERKENSLMAFFFGGSIIGGAIVYLLMPKAH